MTCEKCGFEYEGEYCPVCEVENINTAVKAPSKKSVCGLLGLIISSASLMFFGWPLSLVGLILSLIGKGKCKKDGVAKAGVIMSVITLIYHVICKIISSIVAAINLLLAVLALILNIIVIFAPLLEYVI